MKPLLCINFIILPLFFLLLIIQIFRAIRKSKPPTRNNLPPGPWKFPIIGSLPQLVAAYFSSPSSSSLPHHILRDLAKKHGPIMHLQLGQVSTVVISSARLAKEVLKIHDLAVANRQQFFATKIVFYDNGDLIFSPYGNFWRQMNKICIIELLSAKKVRSFHPIREEEVSRVVESIRSLSSSGSPVDLGKMVYSLQNTVSSRAVFGSKCKDQDEFIGIILDVVAYIGGFDVANFFPSLKFLPVLNGMMSRVKKTHRKADRILNDIIDQHMGGTTRQRDEEDLLDVLLRVKETGDLEFPITLDNIKAIILDMFGAGTETTSTTTEWAMSEMIRNPRVMEKVQAELREVFKGKKVMDETDLQRCSYLKMVIKETLRLRNPFTLLLPRQSREQFEIEGYTIPEKSNIIVNYSAIARDAEYWHDAESFWPERFENSSIDFKGSNFEFIPFGAGRRMCPGMSFAMANLEFVLAQLLYHFDWNLPNGMKPKDLDMTELFGATVRKKNSLCLVATPYSPP